MHAIMLFLRPKVDMGISSWYCEDDVVGFTQLFLTGYDVILIGRKPVLRRLRVNNIARCKHILERTWTQYHGLQTLFVL